LTSGPPTTRLTRGRIARCNQMSLLSPRFARSPSTAGNTREHPRKHWGSWSAVLVRSRLFPALGTAKGPQESRCGPFRRRIRTFDADPSALHMFAFSQSAATVMSRPAASLTIVSRRTLNSPHARSRRSWSAQSRRVVRIVPGCSASVPKDALSRLARVGSPTVTASSSFRAEQRSVRWSLTSRADS
jgi:hypothetical protein